MKKLNIIIFSFFGLLILSSCSNMLEPDSDLVEYEKDNTLDHATDSVYSVLGIIRQMQNIADRSVLLGEARADLVVTTDAASSDLKRLASFDFSQENVYNQASDYYAVINNCNYYLAHVDTAMVRRGRKIFEREFAAVKVFRAWTYLQLVLNYGSVPFVLEPMMTEIAAREALEGPRLSIAEVCDRLINDLTPIANTDLPSFGSVGGYVSKQFFYPARVMLGDLCLWAGRYLEAAQWYHDYLSDRTDYIHLSTRNRATWRSSTRFDLTTISKNYDVTSSEEVLSFIPMESDIFNGVISDLRNVFTSTTDNYYYFQMTPSEGMYKLSEASEYCIQQENKNKTGYDTIYVKKGDVAERRLKGDLRFASNFSQSSAGSENEFSEYSYTYQYLYKFWSDRVPTCRKTVVYLRYAEALNRAGFPQSAMCILKYGLCSDNIKDYVDSVEQVKAGNLIDFDAVEFTKENTIGIHSFGSGDANANIYYALPQPTAALATRQDTVDYQIPLVENMIIDEMALETSFEGYRFYDLMRVALRRNDPAYLAKPISERTGKADDKLRSLLMNTQNWYMPLP